MRVGAALLVLFAHGGWFLFSAWPHYAAYQFAGWLGTELFFALTGFLVLREVLALRDGELRQSARYAAWRTWRIVPLFWLALLVHVLLAQAGQRDLPDETWCYAVLAQNLAGPQPAFFGEAWNLPLLLLFSLFAPGLALGAASLAAPRSTGGAAGDFARERNAMLVALGVLLLVGIALRAEWVLQGAARWDEDVRKVVLARLDACLYGALAALLFERLAPRRAWVALAGVAALAAAAWLFFALPRDASVAAKVLAFVASGIAMAAFCAAGAACVAPASDARAPGVAAPAAARGGEVRWLARPARWCYALYLVNMPLLYAFAQIGFGQTLSPSSSVLRFLAWVLASVALAALLHYLLERPMLEWGRRAIKPSGVAASSRRAAKTARDPGD